MSKIELTTPTSALKAARRAIGFASMGALPSQHVAQKVLTQLDRTIPAGELTKSRELLAEIVAQHVLPTEKAAYSAFKETQDAIDKLNQRDAEVDGEEEAEPNRPS